MKFWKPVYPTAALAAVLAVASVVALVPSQALAGKHPVPSPFNLPSAWYLRFKHGVPKRIVVQLPGEKIPTAYWYLTYSIANVPDPNQPVDASSKLNHDDRIEYFPEFEMVTQDGKIHRSDRKALQPVFQAIKKQENNDLLLSSIQITGTLLQGEDQAKDGVAIWEEPMARIGAFSIYVAGLNSEFVSATDDGGKPILDAKGVEILLRKTLELNYVIWGDEIQPEKDDVQVKPERWVMR